jgi:acyl dehydratase
MTSTPSAPRGRYFEEFSVGERIATAGRTITEADLVNFGALTWDFNSIHTDAVYSAGVGFGQRVAHGALGFAYAIGLMVRTGVMEGTVLAFREVLEWKFSLPIVIGDTIHAEMEVEGTKPMPRLGGGTVTILVKVLNQRQETVMRGRLQVLFQSRPAGSS